MLHFEDEIAKLCLDKYASLKKTGKPRDNEWTVLSGIVLKNSQDNLSVVSLATGTKCLGANKLTNSNIYEIGSRLSDSHAEVLTRRALMRYLYDQIDQLLSSSAMSDVFVLNKNKIIEFRNGISFHFYCSQSPCGDCSIIPKKELNTSDGDDNYLPVKKVKLDNENSGNVKNCKIIMENNEIKVDKKIFAEDIHRTGAKCIKSDVIQDPYLPGINYHITGPLRTKPGRGDPTLSLSCSDKLAKWNFLGIQGALLSLLIPTLKFESIIIGNGCPFSLEAMERGIYRRFGNYNLLPKIYQTSLTFSQFKNDKKIIPCPSSIVWCAVKKRDIEIAVEGRKQGATKNKKGNHLLITRRALFEAFLQIIEKHSCFKNLPPHPKKISYYHYKQWSVEYQKSWNHLKSTIFKAWTVKPANQQDFSL